MDALELLDQLEQEGTKNMRILFLSLQKFWKNANKKKHPDKNHKENQK